MNQIGVMGLPGGSEIILIIFVILLLFGAKKLPELSRSLGKSLGEFKKGQQEGETPDDSMSRVEEGQSEHSDQERSSEDD